jgi:hypothetical protein
MGGQLRCICRGLSRYGLRLLYRKCEGLAEPQETLAVTQLKDPTEI